MLGPEGGKAFAEVLPKSSLTSLKCATAHVLAFCVSAPIEHFDCICTHSLENNDLTNYGKDKSGVVKLAESLPQSKLQSLKCAATQP